MRKSLEISAFRRILANFSFLEREKIPQRFWQKAQPKEFLHLLEEKLLSIFQEVLGALGQVGLVGQVRDSVERAAYRGNPTSRTCQTRPTGRTSLRAFHPTKKAPTLAGAFNLQEEVSYLSSFM